MIALAELPLARLMILLGIFASSVWLAYAMIGLGRREGARVAPTKILAR